MHARRMVATALRSPLAYSVAALAGGAAASQAVTAAASLLLARLYSPAEVGQLGLFLSFVFVASMAVSLRYEQAVVVPQSEADAARLVKLALLLVPVTSLIAGGVLLIFIAIDVLGFGLMPAYAPILAVLALVASGVAGGLRYWLIRVGQFASLAGFTVRQSVARAIGQIAFGLMSLGLTGLLAGDVIGRAFGLIGIGRGASPALRRHLASPGPSLAALARRYSRFPTAGVPSSLLNASATAAPVPIVAALFGLPAAGFLAVVQRAYGLPMTVIGRSVADAVLSGMAAEARSTSGSPRRLFLRVAAVLAVIGLPITIVVMTLGPVIFEALFGPEWRTAGTIAAVVAPWYFAAFVVSPLSGVVIVYERQPLKLLYDLATVTVMIVTLVVATAYEMQLLPTLGIMTLGQVAAYAIYFALLYRIVAVAGTTADQDGAVDSTPIRPADEDVPST